MNVSIKIFLLCPIPEDQKPIQEYIALKDNSGINLTRLSSKIFSSKIFFFLLFSIFLSLSLFLFSNLSFSFLSKKINQLIVLGILSLFFQSCIFFYRWQQLQNRLNQSRLVYEEGSWYDSQVWEKPLLLIKNEKLIASQKIKIILDGLFQNVFFFSILCLSIPFLF
jgi:hypothetical protein